MLGKSIVKELSSTLLRENSWSNNIHIVSETNLLQIFREHKVIYC